MARSISLVLSSGGARGLAHIGAIRALTERGYVIEHVSGSSMGALVGGIYAAGKLEEYADWVCSLRRTDIMQLLDFGWGSSAGLFKGQRIIRVLQELVGDHDIDSLPMGFTAVATDLNRKREVWLNTGSLFAAIRASIAIPFVLAPITRGHQLLVDGGVLNPLPIAPTLAHESGVIVAVDVNGPDEAALNSPFVLTAQAQADAEADDAEAGDVEMEADDAELEEGTRGGKLRRKVTRLVDDFFSGKDDEVVSLGMLEIATESMDAMQVALARLKLSLYSPDLLVQVPRNVAHFFEFERAEELIDLGYRRTSALLDGDE